MGVLRVDQDAILGVVRLDFLSAPTPPEITVSKGHLIEKRFRYRVENGTVKPLAYEAASTLLSLLAWGAAILILAAGINEWLAKRLAGSSHFAGWLDLLAPATWQRDFCGKPQALFGALAAGGFFANQRLGVPPYQNIIESMLTPRATEKIRQPAKLQRVCACSIKFVEEVNTW